MKRTFLLLVIALVSWGLYAQFPGMPPQGKAEVDSLKSEILHVYRHYSVYLPKSYTIDTDKKYPVLYLLHGVWDNNNGWIKRGHLQDVANKIIDAEEAVEMIIVVPDAGREWNGYFNMNGWSYEDFFFTEFLPAIEAKYRIIGDKKHRAVAGLSMGGGGATVYAQKHPDMFSSAYAMSALMGIEEGGGIPPPDERFKELNRTVRENHCVKFLEEAEAEGNKPAIRSFQNALAVEEIHHGLYNKALESVKSGADMPATPIHVCPVCGDTFEGEVPDRCPVCGLPHDKFLEVT